MSNFDMEKKINITLPYNTDIRINAKTINRRFTKNPKYTAYQELVEWEIIKQGNFLGFEPKQKVYIGCMIYRPDFKCDVSDAFTKGIFDAISKTIMVDDRYFAIKYWDWKLCKERPRLEIEIFQDLTTN